MLGCLGEGAGAARLGLAPSPVRLEEGATGARVRIAILAAVTTGALCVLPAGAVAAPLTCGATITSDVRLDADLDCSFAEIPISANRVTLDLNGHILIGRIVVDGHDRVTIRNGTLTAITLRDSHRSRLVNLTLPGGDGHVELIDSSRNVIKGISVGGIAGGISLTRSDRNLIRRSFMFGIQGGGLSGDVESDRNEIRNNRAVGAIGGIGIAVGGSRNIIAGNTASGDAPFGSGLPAEGILLFGGDRNVLAGNDVVSDTDGILVKAAASRTIVARNTANGSGDDGIDVESARTTLWRNKANRNGDLGIEAVPGVHDAGGNRATGNGNPLQCLNVACRPGAVATVFTGSAADPANDLAPFIGDPLPSRPWTSRT